MQQKASYGCSELAHLCGVSADTIRHYDRNGLLIGATRTASGYRRFPIGTERRVSTIRAAIALGFSLRDLASVLKERDSGGKPCERVRSMAEEKLERLDAQVRQLQALQRRLRGVLKDWDAMLARVPASEQARLLDRLA
jgi:DNA-binding transcriptional MerR regulator